jgi:hypothetical protein
MNSITGCNNDSNKETTYKNAFTYCIYSISKFFRVNVETGESVIKEN